MKTTKKLWLSTTILIVLGIGVLVIINISKAKHYEILKKTTLEEYFDQDIKGVRTAIKQWSKNNPNTSKNKSVAHIHFQNGSSSQGKTNQKGLSLNDILTAKKYEDISKNGQHNLIVLYQSGCIEGYKALKTLALESRSLNEKIDFILISSPLKEADFKKAALKVNANFIGQYNNW